MQINAVYEAMCLFLLIGMFIRPYKGINHDFSILFFVSKGLNELKSKE